MSQDQKKNKYYFKQGDEVIHIEMPDIKIFIEEAKFEYYDRPVVGDPTKKESVKKFSGFKCYWFEGEKIQRALFHKRHLLPFKMANLSYTEKIKWINENL